MNKARASDCLTHLQSALKVSALYPEGHPGIQNPLQNFIRELSQLLQAGRPLVLGIVDDVLAFDEVPFYDTDTIWRNLFMSLQGRGIESISFQSGIEVDEALGIVKILTGGDSEDGDDLAALWKKYAIQHASYTELATADDSRGRAHRVYCESLRMIMDVMTELRAGRIPSTPAAVAVVDSMRDLILDDPNALMGMAMLKSYDDYTYNHSVNVTIFCLALGQQLELVPAELRAFGIAGLLHDVGMVRTNETIIRKPGLLNADEMRLIKLHPELGAEILESMQGMDPAAHAMVLQHHIRFDRTGYPERLATEEIHPLANALALADCYDAITSTRPYRRSRDPSEAVRIIQSCAGSAYQPELVEQFIRMLGTYPVGETVRLATGEIAVVIALNPLDAISPTVALVMDPDGVPLAETARVDLAEASEEKRGIVTSVDPLSKGIDVEAILEECLRA
jgi:HD-GYP domain-containing protein (c-di-GMP phosphodiesterase class II)